MGGQRSGKECWSRFDVLSNFLGGHWTRRGMRRDRCWRRLTCGAALPYVRRPHACATTWSGLSQLSREVPALHVTCPSRPLAGCQTAANTQWFASSLASCPHRRSPASLSPDVCHARDQVDGSRAARRVLAGPTDLPACLTRTLRRANFEMGLFAALSKCRLVFPVPVSCTNMSVLAGSDSAHSCDHRAGRGLSRRR